MENADLPISVFLRKDYLPHFVDLSGETIFDLYFDIKRCYPTDTDDRDLTLLTNESVFDIPYAFHEGLLELIDEETGAVVLWPSSGKDLSTQKENEFITLPRKSVVPGKKYNGIRSIPFNISDTLKGVVQPGRQYRIWLRDLDLNIKWWSYSPPPSPTSPIPPSENGKLVAKTTTNKQFHTTPSIRSPPPISINMCLSSSEISYSGPSPTIRVSITNLGSKTITVKSSGEQPYTSTKNPNSRDARITSPLSFPSLKNFIITSSTGSSILNIGDCPSAGPHGLFRANFTTLEPGVALVMEEEFWGQEWLRRKLRDEGGDFSIRLKRREAWWCEGTVEELFVGREKVRWTELWKSACLPVALKSEDEIEFKFVE